MDTKAAARAAKDEVIEQAGSAAALARKLGITKSAVWQWDVIPAERLADVSRISGKTPQDLRPDLFPVAVDAA